MAKQASVFSYFRSGGTRPEAVVIIDSDTSASDTDEDLQSEASRTSSDDSEQRNITCLSTSHSASERSKGSSSSVHPDPSKKLPTDRYERDRVNQQISSFLVQDMLQNPVTSASCERSFSKLKLMKTALRNTMSQDRLSSLVVIGTETDLSDK